MKIVAISDLHGHLPAIPACDILLIAGDICPDSYTNPGWADGDIGRQADWLRRTFREWIDSIPLPTSQKLIVWGNHDYVGEHVSRTALASELHATIAQDELVTCLGLRIWMSPWSNRYGHFAFMRDPEDLAPVYASIPDGVDIIVTHQPPHGCGDRELISPSRYEHVGSREILAALDRVRPQAAVCGHIHRAFGKWDHRGVPVHNVSICDERYQPVHPVTELEMSARPSLRV